MLPSIKEKNPPTTVVAVAEFEHLSQLSLPRLYREFLRVANGGVPVSSKFPILGMPGNQNGSVHVFLGIGAPFASEDLVQTFRHLQGRIPEDVLPIACTAGDDLIFLDMRASREQVKFWDHRHFWSTGEWREQDLYHVADSFEEFLSLLRPATD